ncbi:MAG: hydrogenase maturation nickel metallochaperone HypA [Synechococcales cyanobacterium K44_A2020_017]|uniref:hydrogenase maturation nickel metallochaperone HypA/HybF n=1 Tax=Leptolyngbya sp. CCY15150 TaxID=2767772 RepID=UPI00195224B5|nr:hydrogenase maturation nickel metallochaperone HypA [Leptolyngbya sp. CCY15150]MBF2094604.1 hydrogenase maturation nickel metallochaperone HypA [Synechococcales cyanobacterium K44_A2020_017]
MHELGLTETIVAIALDHAQGAHVLRLTLEVGQLTAVMPDAIRFCFDVCAQGTLLEGALLEIVQPPGLGQCRACGATLSLDSPFGQCTCGSVDLAIIQGQELTLKQLELEELCV